MRKTIHLLTIVLTFLIANTFIAQTAKESVSKSQAELDRIMKFRKTTVINQTPIPLEGVELFNNGSAVSNIGTGPSGSDASLLQDTTLGHTSLGAAFKSSSDFRVADDLSIDGVAWIIDSIKIFGYQTGSATSPSTFTGADLRVWLGQPGVGGSVLWGNIDSNLIVSSKWTGAYRYAESNEGTTRPIMEVVLATPGLTLQPGSYWIDYATTGSGSSGPWAPPITVNGQASTGNASQFANGLWSSLKDGDTNDPLGLPFIVYGTTTTATGPGHALNPIPANGVAGQSVDGNVSWTNPATATSNDVYFSKVLADVENLEASAQVSSGSLATDYAFTGLEYNSTYYWRVVEESLIGTSVGPVWVFNSMRDPLSFYDNFEDSTLANWTITDNSGATPTAIWTRYAAADYPNTYTLPATSEGAVLSADSDEWGSATNGGNTSATLTNGVDLSAYSDAFLEFDYDFRIFSSSADTGRVEISVDGGDWINVFEVIGVDDRNAHANVDISTEAGSSSDIKVRFTYIAVDWNYFFVIDNVEIYGLQLVPVELTSFAANVADGSVVLNWSTATETNNSGFNVERSSDNVSFEAIGFVKGNGTKTSTTNYSYVDNTVSTGNYYYRLKQVDYDGTFDYSNIVEANPGLPTEFALSQNYPNPFNPSTTIKFAAPVDSKVSITLYNTLGQQVMTLVNGQYSAGSHSIRLNASSLTSGVYFYTIQAEGATGSKFVATKKLMLMK